MIIENHKADGTLLHPRSYGIDAVLKNFKGMEHVEVTLFRYGTDEEEVKSLLGKNLVGDPDPDIPEAVLQGATEENAIRYLLENFTEDEVNQFISYLEERYSDLVEKVIAAPLDLPVPLGTGPLAKLPTTSHSGFIFFEKAPNYPLDFAVHGYFDFTLQEELANENS